MRVLMTADTVGGVWTYAMELLEQLSHRGAEVALATMGRPLSRSQRAEARRLRQVEVFESSYKLCWMEDPWADVEAAGDWLLDLSHRIQPDVIHLNDYPHAPLPWQAPVLVVGHSCVLSWHRQVRHRDADETWDHYREVVRRGLRAADVVVAPSHTMLDWLEQYYGPLELCGVIPNGRKARAFRAGNKQPLVLTAGRIWDEAKNVAAVVEAARHIPWGTWVAGDQHQPGQVSQQVPPRLPGVFQLGPLRPSLLAYWYGIASIYALPARYEPFGLTALEAALAGCALVLGDIPTLREIWGDSARYVPPDDPLALAESLNDLIRKPRRLAREARQARRRARSMTAQRMGDAYWQLYTGLRGPGRSSRVSEAPLVAELTEYENSTQEARRTCAS